MFAHYPDDAAGSLWRFGELLFGISGGAWACLAPDHGLQIHDLDAQRRNILSRNAAFPAAEAPSSYTLDHDSATAAQRSVPKAQAKVQAAVPGDVEFDEPHRFCWLVHEASDEHFGTSVPDDALANAGRFVRLGPLARWSGSAR